MAEENMGKGIVPVASLPGAARQELPNPGFWSIWKLLGRPQDWEVEAAPFDTNVMHKLYDIRFFAEHNGICFRPIWPRCGEVWRPSILQFLVLHLRTIGFLRRVRKAERSGAPEASSPKGPTNVTPELPKAPRAHGEKEGGGDA